MFNPFEKDTLRWYLFNQLAETLDEDHMLTPLEVAHIVNKTTLSETPLPPRPSVEL